MGRKQTEEGADASSCFHAVAGETTARMALSAKAVGGRRPGAALYDDLRPKGEALLVRGRPPSIDRCMDGTGRARGRT